MNGDFSVCYSLISKKCLFSIEVKALITFMIFIVPLFGADCAFQDHYLQKKVPVTFHYLIGSFRLAHALGIKNED